MVCILINKFYLKLKYTTLELMAKNHNYFVTSLIMIMTGPDTEKFQVHSNQGTKKKINK